MFKLIRYFILIGIVFFTGYIFGIKDVKFLKIISSSMEPTLSIGDKIISVKSNDIKRKDIVVLLSPEGEKEFLIKRVIGLPGEKIKIEKGYVYINGEKLQEPYIKERPEYLFKEIEIPPGTYFLLGDNRNESEDSTTWGPVEKNFIVGKVLCRYHPFRKFKIF
ncbi:MAG TPA: signal peptidase I [bacterium]|nr:signal peptidase I [bacterium]HOM26462.1 signal peptidase I [bacterium]